MFGFLNVCVQIVEIVQPRRVIIVLDNRQLARLGESSQLARTHSEIQSRLFRSQQPSRDVTRYAHLPSKIGHNLGTVIFRLRKPLIRCRLERRKKTRRISNPPRVSGISAFDGRCRSPGTPAP